MLEQGTVVFYLEMCREEGVSLQRGMNFRLKGGMSVILMSLRPGAPYADRIEDEGRMLIYEGHDIPVTGGGPDPKTVDQPMHNPRGGLTQNGLFYEAAKKHMQASTKPEFVRVYEKIKSGIWAFNGVFELIDGWQELSNAREVFKFKLELVDENAALSGARPADIDHNRLIPT